jgi:hypothetical protein
VVFSFELIGFVKYTLVHFAALLRSLRLNDSFQVRNQMEPLDISVTQHSSSGALHFPSGTMQSLSVMLLPHPVTQQSASAMPHYGSVRQHSHPGTPHRGPGMKHRPSGRLQRLSGSIHHNSDTPHCASAQRFCDPVKCPEHNACWQHYRTLMKEHAPALIYCPFDFTKGKVDDINRLFIRTEVGNDSPNLLYKLMVKFICRLYKMQVVKWGNHVWQIGKACRRCTFAYGGSSRNTGHSQTIPLGIQK